MKMKLLVDGNDGLEARAAGSEYTLKTDWGMRMLANGLAEPMDDEATAFVANEGRMNTCHSTAYVEAAISHGAKEIPSLRFVPAELHAGNKMVSDFLKKYPHSKPKKDEPPAPTP